MARDPDSYSQFDEIIETADIDYEASPWVDGAMECKFELLNTLMGSALTSGRKPNGEIDQASGAFAKAIDCWAAVEFRRAGFPPDSVWPRSTMPRVLTQELSTLSSILTDPEQEVGWAAMRRKLSTWLANNDKSPQVAPTEANVLGGVYRKQADVLIADWSTGIELMVSTKTMLRSYGKNLRNRFEESFGDAINLKKRFPLGSFGFLFAVDTRVPRSDFVFLCHMLERLVDDASYDAACLLVVDLDTNALDVGGDLVVPSLLTPGRFFDTLVSRVVEQTPASHHPKVRGFRGLEVDGDEGELV